MASKDLPSEYTFKIVLIGDPAVGKTSLILRLSDDVFHSDHVSTNGSNLKTKQCPFGKKSVKIILADTEGQERFRTISRSIYRGANAIIVVYDQANQKTFQNVQYWLYEVEKYADADTSTFLVANKNDLLPEVSSSTGKTFADSKGIPFLETCAKNDVNVDLLFQNVVQSIGGRLYKNEDWNRFKMVKDGSSSSVNMPSSTGSGPSSSTHLNPHSKKKSCAIL